MTALTCPHGAACVHCRLDQLPTTTSAPAPQVPRLLLTLEEAAGSLGVTYEHLVTLIRDAGLDDQVVTGIGRGRKIRPSTLDELVARHADRKAS